MRMYEISVCFNCPVCHTRIIKTEMSDKPLDKEQEMLFDRLAREKHIQLHQKADKYDRLCRYKDEIMEVFENGD